MDDQEFPNTLNLVTTEHEGTKIFIDVEINDAGDLMLSGQDIGAAPSAIFGDSDYEYWVSVPAKSKDWVLLNLLKDRFGGDAGASSAFRKWLDERHIPNQFSSY